MSLEYRSNFSSVEPRSDQGNNKYDTYDTIILVHGGTVVGRATVTGPIFERFSTRRKGNASCLQKPSDPASPDDYGDLIATLSGRALTVVDVAKWESRRRFYLGETA